MTTSPALRASVVARRSPSVVLDRPMAALTARAGGVAAVLLASASWALIGLTWSDAVLPVGASHVQDVVLCVAFLAFSLVGALITVRRPGNRVGAIFLASGIALQSWILTYRYAAYGLEVRTGDQLPGSELAAWSAAWIVMPGLGLALVALPLVYPDGHLVSSKHRPVALFAGCALVFAALTWATVPGPVDRFEGVVNPVGVGVVGRLGLDGAGWFLTVCAVVVSTGSQLIRYVRSEGRERRQIQWLALVAVIAVIAIVTTTVASETGTAVAGSVADVLFPVGLACLPVAAVVAICFHDLYDLDVVVSKTITFGVVAVFVVGTYVVVVVGIGAAVGSAGEPNLALSVFATAVVAIAFQPVLIRVRSLADRLIYGDRAPPYEVLASLAHRMGDALDPYAVLPEMASMVTAGTGAERTDIWLVIGEEMQRVSTSSPDTPAPTRVMLDDGLRVAGDAACVVEVRRHDRLLGAITVVMPPGVAMTSTEVRLLDDLGAQAGLVLSNVRLVEELKSSRQRLVSAQDVERRRLERNIHDGVQQRLLALALNLKMLSARTRDETTDALVDALEAAAVDAQDALTDLRQLARGIHPAIVTEGGLVAALDSLAERVPIPVDLDAPDTGRLPTTVEVTIYYVVAEALANVVKHAAASRTGITLRRRDERVVVRITDDGAGGAEPAPGSGLSGLTDRVEALGGRFTIDSHPGTGTLIEADLPCRSS